MPTLKIKKETTLKYQKKYNEKEMCHTSNIHGTSHSYC